MSSVEPPNNQLFFFRFITHEQSLKQRTTSCFLLTNRMFNVIYFTSTKLNGYNKWTSACKKMSDILSGRESGPRCRWEKVLQACGWQCAVGQVRHAFGRKLQGWQMRNLRTRIRTASWGQPCFTQANPESRRSDGMLHRSWERRQNTDVPPQEALRSFHKDYRYTWTDTACWTSQVRTSVW